MPPIFDNIEADLLPALEQTLELSNRADFCVGYFNLRGWKELDSHVEAWAGGRENCCRLLVGMQRLPQEELRAAFSLTQGQDQLDNQSCFLIRLSSKNLDRVLRFPPGENVPRFHVVDLVLLSFREPNPLSALIWAPVTIFDGPKADSDN